MSRGPYPILLMLAMSLPGAVRALGLGDIRVDSALNEPLSAQIDIVGATRDELIALTAKVANRDIFQRYGADRPAFLSSATFKVGLDAQGRPVLNVRSAEGFTDPLVSFLVELRWGRNEVIREYSLLLDPPGFGSPHQASDVAVAYSAPLSPPETGAQAAAATPSLDPLRERQVADQPNQIRTAEAWRPPAIAATSTGYTHYKIVTGDTLRGIARRTGARSESQAQRTMLAIFRANANAFGGNINRMHLGAVLIIPTATELAAISAADAKREVHAQMAAWRLDGRPNAARRVAASPVPLAASAPNAAIASAPIAPIASIASASTASAARIASAASPGPIASNAMASHAIASGATAAAPIASALVAPGSTPAAPADSDASLKNRVQSLEQALDELHKQLANENAKIQDLKQAAPGVAAPAVAAPAVAAPAVAAPAVAAPAIAAAPAVAAPAIAAAPAVAAPAVAAPAVAAAGSAELVQVPIVAVSHGQDASSSVASPLPVSSKAVFGPIAITLALLAGGFAYIRRRLAPAPVKSDKAALAVDPQHDTSDIAPSEGGAINAAAEMPQATGKSEATAFAAIEPPKRVEAAIPVASKTSRKSANNATTVSLAIDTEALERSYLDLGIDTPLDTVVVETSDLDTTIAKANLDTVAIDTKKLDAAAIDGTKLDYNLLDLDATTQHVHMPSALNDHVVVAERRTSIADALKMAIERDPHRPDLHMKLLETYYSAASINQRAFMELARKLAREGDCLSPDDWKKVAMMGREIASDDILFADQSKDDDTLTNCA